MRDWLSQRPDLERLATVDGFAAQVAITLCDQRQAKRIHEHTVADRRFRGDYCDAGDEQRIHDVTFRH
jgi:hypothetical protein